MSKREYPRVEKGVILYGPEDEPENRKPSNPHQEEDAGPINLNEAGVDELRTIKGVGKKTAGDIVASREAGGPFQSLEDCAERVGGVSLEQLEAAGATV